MTASRRGTISPKYTDSPASAVSLQIEPLQEGSDGTFQTLAAMRAAVLGQIPPNFSGYQDSFNQRYASWIVLRDRLEANTPDAMPALFCFVRDQIAYINHPWNMQVVQDCRRTLEFGTGDCVSKSVCLATVLAARGIASRFVAQAPDAEGFSHVYVEANLDGAWVALDPTADGRDDRPWFEPGRFQRLPDGGFETTFNIF